MVELFLRVVFSSLIIILLGFGVKWLLNIITGNTEDIEPPENVECKDWQEALGKGVLDKGVPKYLPPTRCLGILESFISLIAFWMGAHIIIAGWLAFKMAAKWEVWKNIIQVPDSLEDTSKLSYLRARNAWGTWLLNRFLIGTLTNILIGFLAYCLGKYLCEILKLLL